MSVTGVDRPALEAGTAIDASKDAVQILGK